MRRIPAAEAESDPTTLLRSAEVARLLRVHPKHVFRLLRAGMPGMRVGGEWRFLRDDVLAWARDRGARRPAGVAGPVLASNDDEAVAILLRALRADGGPVVGWVQADSMTALDLLSRDRAAIAGFHRREVPATVAGRRLVRLRLVAREVGVVGRRGRGAPGIAAFAERRVASRPASAGVRSTLDAALERAGISPAMVQARARSLPSNRDVVLAVVRGDADVGIASRDWADRCGLPFRALGVEEYDLLTPADRLADAAVMALCDAARRRDVCRAVAALPGHSVRDAGTLRFEPERRS